MDTSQPIKEASSVRRQAAGGMTLLELIMAAALVGLVGTAFAGLYGTAQRFLIQETEMAILQSEVGFAMEHISRTGLPATAVQSGTSGSKVRLWFRTDTAGTSQTDDDVWRLYEWDSTPTDKILYFYNLGVGSGPLSAPNTVPPAISVTPEIIARRIQLFQFAVAPPPQVLVTMTINSEQGRAPAPAMVTFDLSPRSMSAS